VRIKVPGERMVGEDVELKLRAMPLTTCLRINGCWATPCAATENSSPSGPGGSAVAYRAADSRQRHPVYTYEPAPGADEAGQLIGADGPWINPSLRKETNERASRLGLLFDVDIRARQ